MTHSVHFLERLNIYMSGATTAVLLLIVAYACGWMGGRARGLSWSVTATPLKIFVLFWLVLFPVRGRFAGTCRGARGGLIACPVFFSFCYCLRKKG